MDFGGVEGIAVVGGECSVLVVGVSIALTGLDCCGHDLYVFALCSCKGCVMVVFLIRGAKS